jgi:hypothetical protein
MKEAVGRCAAHIGRETGVKAAKRVIRRAAICAPQRPEIDLTMTKEQFRQKSTGFAAAC